MSKFRTTEISDPRFESNHLRFITIKTNNLRGRGDMLVYVPPGQNEAVLPIVLLLHGVYGSCWSWAHQAGVHINMQKWISQKILPPMILAMPSDGLWGDGSGYLDHGEKNFEAWITEDVVSALKENIKGAAVNSPIFITGLSMGGFGALRLGAKYGSMFSGISAHSSITRLEQMDQFVEEPLIHYRQTDPMDEDVFETIRQNLSSLPPVRFDCGQEDQLIEPNRKLHRQLQELKIAHEYQEFEGKHEWVYWEKHVQDSLLFFARILEEKDQGFR